MTADYADQVLAWADELRAGSTRTWSDFRAGVAGSDSGPDSGVTAVAADGTPLPTAAQLEVVRRLAGRVEVPDFAGLADLVLTTPGPGRGRLDPPLAWPAAPAYGSPPVEPERLSADELLRVVGGALTRLVVDLPSRPATPSRRAWRPLRRRFVLRGAPSTARVVTEALADKGLRAGGPKATHVVVAGPLDVMMAQQWAARVRAGSTIRWRRLWRYNHVRDRIPPAIRLADRAEALARQLGGGRVHVVVAPDTRTAGHLVADVLGTDLPDLDEPAELGSTDLLRVVNAPLTLAAGPEGRARVVREVWPGLTEGEQPRRIGVPKEHLEWAVARAEREVERLRRGAAAAGYAVHGDPDLLVPDQGADLRRAIRRKDTLDLGLEVLGRAWTARVSSDPSAEEVR